MTNDDLLMIANRNLRVLDTVAHKLLAVDAKTELRAIELSLLYLLRKVHDENVLVSHWFKRRDCF
jgi:hypothetical protein